MSSLFGTGSNDETGRPIVIESPTFIIAANTMHAVAEEVAQSVDIPFLHIAKVAAEHVEASRQTTVGLLATWLLSSLAAWLILPISARMAVLLGNGMELFDA